MSNPDNRIRLKQIIDLYKAGQKSEARRLIGEVVKASPDDADAWYVAGQVLDQSPQKIKAFERALGINPSHSHARKALDELRQTQQLLDDVLTDGLLDDVLVEDFGEPLVEQHPSATPSPSSTLDFSNPRILGGIIGGTLLVGMLLGAICLGTISSGKFLGIVFAPSPTPSRTPTATATFTPSHTPTATLDLAATGTALMQTQAALDMGLTVTAVAVVNRQVETAVAGTALAQGNQTAANIQAAAGVATIPPTWTLPADNLAGLPPTATSEPEVQGNYVPLNFNLVQADYSPTMDRIIFVSANPNQLHIFNPADASDTVVELSRVPTAVGVGPDGLFAAVGHDAKLSYVDLKNARVVTTLDVTADVGQVVLTGNGWIYAAPSRDQWENLRAINISSNTEVIAGGIYAGVEMRMHPDGNRLYTATRGLSPSDIERFDLVDGVPLEGHDSRYHGDYPMCGDVWFSADGTHIFTPCGTVLRSSVNLEDDMIYNGTLQDMQYIAYLVHVPSLGKLIGISGGDNTLAVWDYESYTTLSLTRLPNFVVNSQLHPVHGLYVFVNPATTRYYAIVQSDEAGGSAFALMVADIPA